MGLLPSDIEAVTMILKASEQRIVKHVVSLHKKMAAQLTGCEKFVSELSNKAETIATGVADLKVLTLQNSAVLAHGTTSSKH